MDPSLLRSSRVRSKNAMRTLPSAYAVYRPVPSPVEAATTSTDWTPHTSPIGSGSRSRSSAALRKATSLGATFPIGIFPTTVKGRNLPNSSFPSATCTPSGTGSPDAWNTLLRYPPAPATVAGTTSDLYIAGVVAPPRSSATWNTNDPPSVVASAVPSSKPASASIRRPVRHGTPPPLVSHALTAHITVPSESSTTGARPIVPGNPARSASAHQASSPSLTHTRLFGSSSVTAVEEAGRTVTVPVLGLGFRVASVSVPPFTTAVRRSMG